MKSKSLQQQLRFVIFSLCFLGILTSCGKDEEGAPFDGTWAATGQITVDDVSFEYKDIMTFNNGSFRNIGQLKNPSTNKWIDLVGLKGSVADHSNSMSITIKEIGMSSMDMLSGMPTGSIIYYKDGEPEFNSLMTQSGLTRTFSSDYSISGNSLTLKTDTNNDGDYTDQNETTVYLKQ